MEHLIIIIDKNKNVEPKKYSCAIQLKTKEEAVKTAKLAYEKIHKNFSYDAYYFKHDGL